jgi:tetratricopeptide (TPR) repeat protein
MAEAFLAWPLCHAGQSRRGIELLVGILPILKGVRFAPLELWITSFLADAYWLVGEQRKGCQTARELLRIAEAHGGRYSIGHAHFLLGEMSLEMNSTQAASHFQNSIAVFQEIKAENALAMAYAGYGRLHKQQGNTERAREYLTQALEIFERLDTLIEPDKVREQLEDLPE